jgi:fumarate reductase flavoprotein subunit
MRGRVVIVGAGTAGMPCAIALAEAGLRPTVLEKSNRIGGSLHLSAGHMSAAGTRRQRMRGIEDSADLHYEDVIRIGRGKNDPRIVRRAVDAAAGAIDWLEDLGFPFLDETPVIYYGHEPYSAPRTYWGAEFGRAILGTIVPRFSELADAGAIDLRLGTAMRELALVDGAVAGVVADGPDGPTVVDCDIVVFATGGYTGDPELFRELHPGVDCLVGGMPTSTGDGLRAARSVGAGTRNFDCYLPSVGGIEWPPESGGIDSWEAWANTMGGYRQAREIHVNERGERFIDEDIISPDARERALVEQGGVMWIVFDDAAISDDEPLIAEWAGDRLRANARQGRGMWAADDIRTLAGMAGIDPDGLEATVAEVALTAREGQPDPFGRANRPSPLTKAPFYAVRSQAATLLSFGGLLVDDRLRVLRESGEPIAGLYAVGEVIGAGTTMGNSYCGGMCVTPAISLGRALGQELAGALVPQG